MAKILEISNLVFMEKKFIIPILVLSRGVLFLFKDLVDQGKAHLLD